MTSHENLLLVRMLRYQGQIEDGKLELVLKLAEEHRDHPELLERLTGEGLVDEEWAERARRYLRGKARSLARAREELFSLDRAFGQMALARGWIEVADLEGALLEQERLRRSNLSFRIGEILVRSGVLSVQQVRELLREQGYENLTCDGCDQVIRGDGRTLPSDCPSCGGTLAPSVYLEFVQHDLAAPKR